MILQFRLFGLVMELLWMNGLLFGFSLPDRYVKAMGINCGPLCLCIYRDEVKPICERCGGNLRRGVHGDVAGILLCKPKPPEPPPLIVPPCGC